MPRATKLLSKISVSITKLCELQFHYKFANIKHQIKKFFLVEKNETTLQLNYY